MKAGTPVQRHRLHSFTLRVQPVLYCLELLRTWILRGCRFFGRSHSHNQTTRFGQESLSLFLELDALVQKQSQPDKAEGDQQQAGEKDDLAGDGNKSKVGTLSLGMGSQRSPPENVGIQKIPGMLLGLAETLDAQKRTGGRGAGTPVVQVTTMPIRYA